MWKQCYFIIDYFRMQRHLSQLNSDLSIRYSFINSYVPGPAWVRRLPRLHRREQNYPLAILQINPTGLLWETSGESCRGV